jgi:hypothetical protein
MPDKPRSAFIIKRPSGGQLSAGHSDLPDRFFDQPMTTIAYRMADMIPSAVVDDEVARLDRVIVAQICHLAEGGAQTWRQLLTSHAGFLHGTAFLGEVDVVVALHGEEGPQSGSRIPEPVTAHLTADEVRGAIGALNADTRHFVDLPLLPDVDDE